MAIKRSSCVLRLSDFWRNPLVILKCIVTRKEFLGQEKEEAMPNSLFFQILDPLLQLRIRHFRSRKTILTWKIYNYQAAKGKTVESKSLFAFRFGVCSCCCLFRIQIGIWSKARELDFVWISLDTGSNSWRIFLH